MGGRARKRRVEDVCGGRGIWRRRPEGLRTEGGGRRAEGGLGCTHGGAVRIGSASRDRRASDAPHDPQHMSSAKTVDLPSSLLTTSFPVHICLVRPFGQLALKLSLPDALLDLQFDQVFQIPQSCDVIPIQPATAHYDTQSIPTDPGSEPQLSSTQRLLAMPQAGKVAILRLSFHLCC